ncbi:MAG: phosphatidate cytidylyltransferase [Solirubrobacteraceae bacterium]|nr:phosphatidate cytidylyltransferase [Solirubrobacteraceae bacterium]
MSTGRRAPRRRAGSDLGPRVLAAIPAIAFAIFIVVEGGLVFALGVMALGLACLHELYGMLRGSRPVNLAGFLALIGLVLAARYGAPAQILLVAVAAVPVLFVLTVLRPLDAPPTAAIASTLLGVYWIGLAVAHIVLLRDLPHGGGVVIDVLIGTFLGDTGAYFGGRMFGRRPLAPRISPNKTVEGLVVGMVTAVLAVWLASTYQEWLHGWQALVLGVAVAIAAPVGDLFESLVKRGAGAKDAGRLFGAHGGALDRLDAALFTLVAGYYVWTAMV